MLDHLSESGSERKHSVIPASLFVIPAQAGIQSFRHCEAHSAVAIPVPFSFCTSPYNLSCHSRTSGNPGLLSFPSPISPFEGQQA